MDKRLSSGVKTLLILGTIIFPGPLLGIILGIIWMTGSQYAEDKKSFGKILLIIGIVVAIIACILYFTVGALLGPLIPEDMGTY
ncbi:MAG: hypothetical protein MJB12_08250 [Firmicutes bacterium]|nr:hypothetical protein [Bacillota bacterium]